MPKPVLVVEDEIFVAIDIAEELIARGFEVLGPYHRLSEAVPACAAGGLAAAVLDVRLLDGEVFPLADLLVRLDVPIVFHSGHMADRELRDRYPAARVCEKPCPPFRLAAVVEQAIEAPMPRPHVRPVLSQADRPA